MIQDFSEIVPVLQIAVGPVILVSGVGLLLLSLTNRYGRVIDRARFLGDGLRKSGDGDGHVWDQIRILRRRAKLLRTSITYGATSVLCAAVLVIGIFVGSLIHFAPTAFVVVMFSTCMLSLIGSLVCFIQDVNQSLAALDLDMEDVKKAKERR
jgi:VIT1/CCC1 family predicted Fe2+/Mn2+ transporter